MMPRCLVTGAGGFLGRWIARALTADGYDVVGATRSQLDVTRPEHFDAQGGEFETVVHAAAFVPAGVAGPQDVPSALAASALGTHNALVWAAARGVRRFVYVSSSDVYSPTATLPVREDAATDPRGPAVYYGLGKLWGDQLCRAFRDATNLSTVCLRLSAIHGHGMRPRGVVSAFWRLASEGRPLPVNAPRASGDFLYVADACRAVLCALRSPTVNPVYNIGSGRETTLEELAHAAWATLRPGEVPRVELGTGTGRRFVLDISRAADEIGFTPAYDLRAGFEAWRAESA